MLPVGISADGLMDPLTTSVAAILAVAVLLGVLGLGFSVALSKIKWGLGFKILWV